MTQDNLMTQPSPSLVSVARAIARSGGFDFEREGVQIVMMNYARAAVEAFHGYVEGGEAA